MSFYEFYMLLEGKAEDLVASNPELGDAYSLGVKNVNYLNWILRVKGHEPVRDIAPVLLAFDRNKQKLIKKDLGSYKSVGELRKSLEETERPKEQKELDRNSSETAFLGKFGQWYVVMPKTKTGSCYWGKGTSWCTAYTVSGNMFFHYSAFEKVTLFYLIKESGNPRVDTEAKLSIGFSDEGIDYENNSTVDAANNPLSEWSLKTILGPQYEPIMNAMKSHVAELNGKHPTREIMERIASGQADFQDLEDEMALGDSFKNYYPEHLIRGIAKYNLTADGVWTIMRHVFIFGGYEEAVQDLITYSKDMFKTAKLLIDYFKMEENRIKGKFVSVILRFGSLNRMDSQELRVNFNKLEELMRLWGAKNLYLLSHADVKELFSVFTQKIGKDGLKEGEDPESRLRLLFAKYAPEWDKEHIDYAIANSYKSLRSK